MNDLTRFLPALEQGGRQVAERLSPLVAPPASPEPASTLIDLNIGRRSPWRRRKSEHSMPEQRSWRLRRRAS